MSRTLAAAKQHAPAKPDGPGHQSPQLETEAGESAGLPPFLQTGIQRQAQGGSSSPPGNGAPPSAGPPGDGAAVQRIAGAGLRDADSQLPHFARVQRSFGRHDISGVRVRVGGAAAAANESLGALAYTRGSSIAFRSAPDLRLAAH